jgi:hypothetical protein
MEKKYSHSQLAGKRVIKNPIIEGLEILLKSKGITYEDTGRYILIELGNSRMLVSHTAHKVMYWVLGMGEHIETGINGFDSPESILTWGTNIHEGNI